jgi:tripartite-type tricarboxylate transporter receptor subunit TctC
MVNLPRWTFLHLAAGAAALPAATRIARAETWPTRPMHIVAPYPPGGGNPTSSRASSVRAARLPIVQGLYAS